MGMFDSFYATLTCPSCGQEQNAELQTKIGVCCLKRYYLGDDTVDGGFGIQTGAIECTFFCDNGDCPSKTVDRERVPWPFPPAKIYIKNYRFIGARVRISYDKAIEDEAFDSKFSMPAQATAADQLDLYDKMHETLIKVNQAIEDWYDPDCAYEALEDIKKLMEPWKGLGT